MTVGKVNNPATRYSYPGSVLAYNYLRGDSSVFATAVNNLHFRLSDPDGYVLPDNVDIPPVTARGFTIAPIEGGSGNHVISTNIHAGTKIFGIYSPRVGDLITVNDRPIKYDDVSPLNKVIKVRTCKTSIDYINLQNKVGGSIIARYLDGTETQIGKVIKPVTGVGRFIGSEYANSGKLRANHAGVICFSTAETNRGGFQIVPSHHFRDRSMNRGGDHHEVFMEVGPVVDPPDLKRYDRGIDGRAPLFTGTFRANTSQVLVKTTISEGFLEFEKARSQHKILNSLNIPQLQMWGYIRDAMYNIEEFKLIP